MSLILSKIEKISNGNILLYGKAGNVTKAFFPSVGVRLFDEKTVRLLDLNGTDHYDFLWQSVGQIVINGTPLTYTADNIGEFVVMLFTNLLVGGGNGLPSGAATEAKQDSVINEIGNVIAALNDKSTETKQDSIIQSLGNIITALAGISTEAKQDSIILELESLRELINAQTVETGNVVSFSGSGVENLGLPAGTLGEITGISDYASGSVDYTIDGSNPVANSSPRVSTFSYFGTIKNIDLSLVRLKGTSNSSRYSISYNTYKTN